MGDKCGRQVGDKCKLMPPKAPRVSQSGRQVWKAIVGAKWETSVKSCGPTHPEWETSVGDTCGRQVEDKCKLIQPKPPKCEGQVGDKCKIMRPKAPRLGHKCRRQVLERSGRPV